MTNGESPSRKTRGARLWLFRLAAIVLAPLLFLGLLEIVLAVAGVGHSTRFALETTIQGEDFHVANGKFTWRFFPHEIARSPVPFRLNVEKPNNTCRVFVFGGSAAVGTPDHTFGFGRIVDVLLRARYPGVRFEVVNAAVTAINSHVVYQIVQDCARLDPDVFVAYMGNNEVVGPFGVGTVFAPFQASMNTIRASLALRTLRTGQFFASFGSPDSEASRLREWRGLEMVMDKTVPAESPALQTVYGHYRQNLEDICAVARSYGVPVLLSTVAVNLDDCPPFASVHDPELDAARRTEWDESFARGIELEAASRHEDALNAYDTVATIDDGHAELEFRRGRCLRAMGRAEPARVAFVRARDLDALRFRADESLNAVVRDVAKTLPEVALLDAEARFATIADDGVIGAEVFDDHVHFNFHGNYLLGRMVFDEVQRLLPPWVQQKKSEEATLPDEEACARALGLSDWERVKIGDMVVTNLGRPPFTGRLDNDRRLAALRDDVRKMRQRLVPANHDAIEAVYHDAAAARPDDPWIRYNHGHFLIFANRDLERAETLLRVPLQYWPDDLVARQGLAELLIERGKVDQAIEMFDKILEDNPREVSAHVALGKAWARKRDEDRARQSFARAIELRPDSARLRTTIAGIHGDAGQSRDALRHYQAALELDPNFVDAHRGFASLNSQIGKHAVAFEHYEKVLETDPDDAVTHSNLGNAYLRDGKVDQAVYHFRRAVEIEPEFVVARSNLGSALARQGNNAEAVTQLEETLRLSPDFSVAHRSLGYLLYQGGDGDRAWKHLDEAIRLDPNHPFVIYVALAWLYLIPSPSRPTNADRAIELAQRAAAIAQKAHPQVLDVLAAAFAVKGDFPRAMELAHRALQLASDGGLSQTAAQIQTHLESYRAGQTVGAGE